MAVLITGASSGIGEACAEAFAAAGYELILMARRQEKLSSLAQKLNQRNQVMVHTFSLDVRDRQGMEDLVKQNTELFSRTEILVNNAGLAKGLEHLQDGKVEDWDLVIDTNIKGLLYLTKALLPILIQNKGHIVNLGSVAGHWVYEKGAVYCASKFAVHAISEGLRFDLMGTGVRVTEVSPGMVETEFTEVRLGDKEKAKSFYANKNPLQAKDVAETVLWCVKRPSHVNIQEVILFPTEQVGVHGARPQK